ncbi:protein lifeguard 2-like isoform X2 [Protopterus annectens]|uniref:protein lifeguard 2-like isoform X2 n=1 Tax=Protopterus annectens TaxID=7888 RepID=UPI001CFAD183|nr:protein lifeguard 2-like isoform X2 [Protopterus annectens]
MSLPAAPPTYDEAVAGTKDQAYSIPPYALHQPPPPPLPPPSTVPIHPSWGFVHHNPSPGYSNPYGSDMYSPYSDPSSHSSYDGVTAENWEDKNIRRMFIRKVYTIVMTQLLITFGVVAVFTYSEQVQRYIQNNSALYFASYAIFMSTYLALICCSGVRRRYPWNLILLILFTLAMSYMAGMLASYHNTKSVMVCIGVTAMVCLSVTLFCFQTKFDFTSCHGLMFALSMTLLLTGLVMAFTIPFGYFLAYDTQLLIGNRRYSLSPEEHVFGALCLYMDIVYIFIFLLQIFGSRE